MTYVFADTSDLYGPIQVIGDGTGFVAFHRNGESEFYFTPRMLREFVAKLTEAAEKSTNR